MMRSGKRQLIPVAGALAVLLAACTSGGSGGGSGNNPGSAASGSPKQGGTLTVIALDEADKTLDPVQSQTGAASGGGGLRDAAIYDYLVGVDPTSGKLLYGTAASFTSTGGRVWTLKLRSNIKFSDGTTYDAAAVKFNFGRYADPANHSPAQGVAAAIKGMSVVDPLTLKLTLAGANSQFPYSVARYMTFVGSPSAIQKEGKNFGQHPVGAGPFVLKDWLYDDHMDLDRNPTYWDSPRPYVDHMVFKTVHDDTTGVNTVVAGGGQFFSVSTKPETAKKAESAGLHPFLVKNNGGNNIIFNMTKPPFDDPDARIGLAEAIDLKDMAATVFQDPNLEFTTLFGKDSQYYSNIPLTTYNPQDAQSRFNKYAADHGGPLTFSLLSIGGDTEAAAQYMSTTLASFNNVKMKIDTDPNESDIVNRMFAGNYQAGFWGVFFQNPIPALADQYSTKGAYNLSGYSSSQMDAALKTASTSTDVTTQKNAHTTVQRLLAKDVPEFYYGPYDEWSFATSRVQGVQQWNDGIPMWQHVWLTS